MNRFAQWRHRNADRLTALRAARQADLAAGIDRTTIQAWYIGKMKMLREMTATYLEQAGEKRRMGDKEDCRFYIEQARRHRAEGCRKLAID